MNAPQSVQAAFIPLPGTRIRSHTLSGTTLRLAFRGTYGAGPLFFQCRLDLGREATCSSPATFSGLAPGSHTVTVRSWDSNGRKDPSPARLTFKVA
jgi:hypothetical protein